MIFEPAKIPKNDNQRVKAVLRTGALDVKATKLYDVYCFLAKEIANCPVSWTGLIDADRQFILARDGMPDEVPYEMPRNQTLCQFAMEKAKPLIIGNMAKDKRFKYHPAVTDFGVRFYAAFPVVTSDGYILGTLCVSDSKVRRLSDHKINLLIGLASKLAYQLEVQVAQRKSTAESAIIILEKLKLKFSNLLIEDAASILKFMINNVISKEEKDKVIKFGIASLNGDEVEINQEGVSLQNELNMNIGVLNRMKNVIANDDELMNLFGQIKG
jgi:hypothetical protein